MKGDAQQMADAHPTRVAPTTRRTRASGEFAVGLQDLALRRSVIANIKVNTDVVTQARERFDWLYKCLLADDLMPAVETEELEARCVVVAAPSGAGKSHILRRLREHPGLKPTVDAFGPLRPLVAVKAPSPCTLKTLGMQLVKAMTGRRLSSHLKEHEVWGEFYAQADGQGTAVVMIDEFHHVLAKRNVDERLAIVNTLKNLVIPDPADPLRPPGAELRPILLVLSGMPSVAKTIEMDEQLLRRRLVISIDPLGRSDAELKKAKRFLELVEPRLGFDQPSGLAEPDMVLRMMRASNGYLGRMMAILKEAAFLAIRTDAPRIDRALHLAIVFEEIFKLGPKRNPFLVADISSCPATPEHAFERLTLLRGTGDELPQEHRDA